MTKSKEIVINWPAWSKLINPRFIPLVENRDRYLILYGGRGSSKSDFTAKKLIFRCLVEKHFRCVLVREFYTDIKDSQYDQIKNIIEKYGLAELFEFKLQPLEIICKANKNKFIARGCDDTTKLKSLTDFSAVWYEESIISEEDFIRITTSIRTTKADYLQEIFTINPEVEGNYQESWFYKRFFEGHSEKSFSDVRIVDIGDGKQANITYTTHHSTYRDNKWIPNDFIAFLIDQKRTNPYYYTVYCEGNWGNKQLGGLAYKKFNRGVHVYQKLDYNPDLPLHISFDFNVSPYMTLGIFQVDGKNVNCIDTIAARSPENTTKGICREFVRRYQSHRAGLFIYGDPSGRNADTKMENGFNNYSIIERELEFFKPILRVAKKHPPVVMRLNFINSIFESSFNGINISIAEKAVELITDLLFQKENTDGTKLKEKTSKGGQTFEKYGHFSDCVLGDTLVTTIFGPKRIDEIKVGDLVLTRSGYKRVLSWMDKGVKAVNTYNINGNTLTCTPDHKIYSLEYGFIPADTLLNKTHPITYSIYNDKQDKIQAHTALLDVKTSTTNVSGERLERVYDIMVEDAHEFYANNILVHNCFDYFMCEAFDDDFHEYQEGPRQKVMVLGKAEDNQNHSMSY